MRHAIQSQHVSGGAIVDPVRSGVLDHGIETLVHDLLQALVHGLLIPEEPLPILHPLE